jgi:hypothetical protein
MPTYNGWNVVTMPSTPPAPMSIEVQRNDIVTTNTNPFTGQQQVYDWNANFYEVSLSMPPMTASQWSSWETFFDSCKGQVCVFVVPFYTLNTTVFTTDGTTQRYFRLKTNSTKYSIQTGNIYHVVFEIRSAI